MKAATTDDADDDSDDDEYGAALHINRIPAKLMAALYQDDNPPRGVPTLLQLCERAVAAMLYIAVQR
jgi:hypothetical protein